MSEQPPADQTPHEWHALRDIPWKWRCSRCGDEATVLVRAHLPPFGCKPPQPPQQELERARGEEAPRLTTPGE